MKTFNQPSNLTMIKFSDVLSLLLSFLTSFPHINVFFHSLAIGLRGPFSLPLNLEFNLTVYSRFSRRFSSTFSYKIRNEFHQNGQEKYGARFLLWNNRLYMSQWSKQVTRFYYILLILKNLHLFEWSLSAHVPCSDILLTNNCLNGIK